MALNDPPERDKKAADRPAPAAAAKTFSGEAEKQRLKLSERNSGSAVSALGARLDIRKLSVDSARKSLRFIAHRCEIGEAGLRVTLVSGEARQIPFASIAGVVVRQLPVDPPWDGALILDIVPAPETAAEPVRIFATTVMNYAAIPGGASSSRLDNTRRFTAFLAERCPGATLDEPTLTFMRGPRAPLRFVNVTQFLEYDLIYG